MSSDLSKGNLKSRSHAVPSRYRQAAENYSHSSRETISQNNLSSHEDTVCKQSITLWSNESVMSKGISINKHTSTPDSQKHVLLPSLDASSITDSSGFLCLPHMKQKSTFNVKSVPSKKIQKKFKDISVRYPSDANETIQVLPNMVTKDCEAELDVYYAQYLQAKLLESNAIRAFALRAKCALEKIYEVWSLINLLLHKKGLLQKKINFSSHIFFLHNHLHKQETFLESIEETIPLFKKNYEEISLAIEKVSHKLEVKNILNPSDITEEEILLLLNKIANFVQCIEKSVVNKTEIIQSAEVANYVITQAKLIIEEIKRGTSLLSDCQEVLLSETNLQLN